MYYHLSQGQSGTFMHTYVLRFRIFMNNRKIFLSPYLHGLSSNFLVVELLLYSILANSNYCIIKMTVLNRIDPPKCCHLVAATYGAVGIAMATCTAFNLSYISAAIQINQNPTIIRICDWILENRPNCHTWPTYSILLAQPIAIHSYTTHALLH